MLKEGKYRLRDSEQQLHRQNLLRSGIVEKKIDAAVATIIVAIILVHSRVVYWSCYEVGLDAK